MFSPNFEVLILIINIIIYKPIITALVILHNNIAYRPKNSNTSNPKLDKFWSKNTNAADEYYNIRCQHLKGV